MKGIDMKKRALISVYDKTGILDFAKFLISKGVEIISTGGTYKYLKENNIEVIEVSKITNFEEMLDGRVKTLHPNIHGGILALRDNEEHMRTLKERNIDTIDYVIVNLYPFFEKVKEWIHSVSSSECVYLLLFGYSFINHESKTIDVGGFFLHSYLNLFRIEF